MYYLEEINDLEDSFEDTNIEKFELLLHASYIQIYGEIKMPIFQVMEIKL